MRNLIGAALALLAAASLAGCGQLTPTGQSPTPTGGAIPAAAQSLSLPAGQLAMRFAPGDTFKIKHRQIDSIVMGTGGRNKTEMMTTTVEIRYAFKDAAADGTIHLIATKDHARVEMGHGAGRPPEIYDSSDPAGAFLPQDPFVLAVGDPVDVYVAPNGEVVGLGGTGAIVEREAGAATQIYVASKTREELLRTFERPYRSGLPVFARQPVNVGDRWQRTLPFSDTLMDLPFAFESSFALAGRGDGLATITFTGTGALVHAEGALQIPPSQDPMAAAEVISESGTIMVDEATGWPRTVQVDRSYVMDYSRVPKSPAAALAMVMEIRLSRTSEWLK